MSLCPKLLSENGQGLWQSAGLCSQGRIIFMTIPNVWQLTGHGRPGQRSYKLLSASTPFLVFLCNTSMCLPLRGDSEFWKQAENDGQVWLKWNQVRSK